MAKGDSKIQSQGGGIRESAQRVGNILEEYARFNDRKIDYDNRTVTLGDGETMSLDEYDKRVQDLTKRYLIEAQTQRSLGYNPNTGEIEQKPTNAKTIENMNEAQIDKEIDAVMRQISRARATMGASATESAYARQMRESFPLGAGGSGWTEARKRQANREIESSVKKAKAYTEASQRLESLNKRLENLQKAKKTVSGTGKTSAQIAKEKTKQAVAATPKTLKWKTTQKAAWNNGSYKPQIISAGNMEIHGTSGMYSVYRDGKLLGRVSKLSAAKALAERLRR